MARYRYKVEEPTSAYVMSRHKEISADSKFFDVETSLKLVFQAFPGNTSPDAVLAKAACLDRLYSTNVYAIVPMSRHITALRIDEGLDAGRPEIVNDIATLNLENSSRRHYSFATKYCSFSAPDRYHIFDNQVRWLLLAYRKRFKFAEFTEAELFDYPKFASIMDLFSGHFRLDGLSKKQLDKFLWVEAADIWHSAKTQTS